MLKTLGIVEVAPQRLDAKGDRRQGDTQLGHAPLGSEGEDSRWDVRQLAAARFGGTTLIEWVLRRVTDSLRLDGVIAVLDRQAAKSTAHLIPPDVPVFDTDHRNSIDRLVAAAERFPTRAIVRVELRMPFIDPVLIDRLVSAADNHPECDFISFRTTEGSPSSISQLGLVADWCRVAGLRRVQQTCSLDDGMSLADFVVEHEGVLQTRYLQVPDGLDRSDIRLSVTDQADLANAEAIFDALGPEQLDWQRIATLLGNQPAMREQMASLNRSEV